MGTHIGDSQARKKAHPVGQVVKFSTCPKIYAPSLRSFFPTGKAIIVAAMRMKFMTTKTVCSFPITFARVEARIPWQSIQHRKTV